MKLLHLEDEGPLRNVFKTVVNTLDENIEIIQFITGDEAAEYIRTYIDEIKVYVLDIRVPGKLDGLGVARLIREYGSNRPIIINSGYRRPDLKIMTELNLEWMPKPLHILNTGQKIIPWLYGS